MGRVVQLEYPHFKCTLIDLDPSEKDTDTERLAAELRQCRETDAHAGAESQIALRSNRRYGARLMQGNISGSPDKMGMDAREVKNRDMRFPNDYFGRDCTYLITGGYGGIGLLTAEWMIENGAKFLVLVGRKGTTDASQEAITALEKMGAEILVLQGDVSKEQDVQEVLSTIQSKFPPLKGIVHGAGVLEDGVIEQQTWDRFEKVLSPKIAGAWHLHRHTQHMELDFFIMYSSWASIMGSAGQVNHAAANAFLDSLAQYREASGLPTISINWGPWSGQGAAAQSDIGEKLASRGIDSFTPHQGLQALGRILQGSMSQVAVMPLNLDRWFETYPTLIKSRFFDQLLPSEPSRLRADKPSALDIPEQTTDIHQIVLEAASIEQQISVVQQHLRDQLAIILRIPPDELDCQKSFKDLGLDSLTGLELRNRINLHLSISLGATAVWNYPTIDQLTAHITSLFPIDSQTASLPSSPTDTASTGSMASEQELKMLLDELDGLSEDEVHRLLSEDTEKGGAADE